MTNSADPAATAKATATSWPAELRIDPIGRAQGEVRLPGSKSISNRALLLAALAQGSTRLTGLLEADDTSVMIGALRELGVCVEPDGDAVRIEGCAGRFPARHADLHLGNAGTAMRPLAAALAFAGGTYRLDGVARMRERPIGDLVDALRSLGASVHYLGNPGYPPLRIDPVEHPARRQSNSIAGAEVHVRGDVSSQFLSGVLMAAPGFAPAEGIRVVVDGELISRPYVDLTLAMMRSFGVTVREENGAFVVPHANYVAQANYAVEGDASGASYFLALGAIAGGPVRVRGVGRHSLQGDLAFAQVLQSMGARVEMGDDWVESSAPPGANDAGLRAIDFDATAIPDAAMTLAVLALFAQGATRLRGIGSWRVKETDRIHAMATELAKLGATVASGPDWLAVSAPGALHEAWIDTYDDHRMAMCLALAAASGVPVHIREPGCVAKTYPAFFRELDRLRGGAVSLGGGR
jgi:3-phosphoshikimate 1-carboxyvinyltransferase